jgi:hypothetical protein
VLLLVVGCVLVVAAVFPVFEMVRVPAQWEIGLVASKMVMLPVGAICLACAVGLRARVR